MQEIINKIAVYGKISVRRIYSDWTTSKMDSWKNMIKDFSLVPIQQFENTGSKNVSDFALVIDAMDLLHEGIMDCFCIVSSDSDFTRLAQRIREKGKTVIGLGEKKTVKAFINACNEFLYLDEVKETGETKNQTLEEINISDEHIDDKRTIHDYISEAVDELEDDNGWAQMVKIGPYIKRIKPDFNSRGIIIYDNPPKTFNRLKDYFTHFKETYELNKENTLVKKR